MKPNRPPRVGVFTALCLLGAGFVGLAVYQLRLWSALDAGPEVKAQVVEARPRAKGEGLEVRYLVPLADGSFATTGDPFGGLLLSSGERPWAQVPTDAIGQDRSLSVRFDPKDPSRNLPVIGLSGLKHSSLALFASGAFCLGVVGFLVWRRRREQRPSPQASP